MRNNTNDKTDETVLTGKDLNYPLTEETNISNNDLSKQILNLESKIDNLINNKVRTKEIINITKETIQKENKEKKYFPKAIIIILLIFVGVSLADLLYYVYNKANQIKIINAKIQENIITDSQVKAFYTKLDEVNTMFDELTSLISDAKEKQDKIITESEVNDIYSKINDLYSLKKEETENKNVESDNSENKK